jgi:hypothetical protein
MNVANRELCAELHMLSGWDYKILDVYTNDGFPGDVAKPRRTDSLGWSEIPAYDLGYLLRKLPKIVEENGRRFYLEIFPSPRWRFDYISEYKDKFLALSDYCDTPEDAACDLAIKLLERGGVLTKDTEDADLIEVSVIVEDK